MRILFFFVLMIFQVGVVQIQAQTFGLGVNIDDNGAFVNIMNHTNRFQKATGYDANGFPTSDFELVLMDARPVAEWSGQIDDPEQYRTNVSGRYKSCFTGQADVAASGTVVSIEGKIYDPSTNTTYFDIVVGGYPNANHGLVILNFTNTKRLPTAATNTGITQIKVNRPGYPLDTEQIFTDEYIQLCKSADFACYRFYNVQNIWDGEPSYPNTTTWAQRKLPIDVTQKPFTGKRDGWCWEFIVGLANILQKDIWVNIHISCDSQYIVNLAQFLKQNLHPSINIYVENSNEVWSPTQATHGPYNNNQAQQYGITFDQNYARRTVELSQWFSHVFGEQEINKRIRVILAGQHAYNGRSDNHLNYINTTFGEPKKYIYATSTALYFQSTQASGNPDVINDGMITDIEAQIKNQQQSTYRLNHINKAKKWDLAGGCTSYEGGPHLPSGGGNNNLNNQILAHRTEKMGNVTKYNYQEGWKEIGGGLAMYFTLVSGYNRYGCWGITDDYTNPDRNYKMKAIRDIIGTPSEIIEQKKYDETLSYPNPADDRITFRLSGNDTPCTIIITDLLGNSVLTYFGHTGEFTLNTADLSAGMYVLRRVSNSGNAHCVPFVVKRSSVQ